MLSESAREIIKAVAYFPSIGDISDCDGDFNAAAPELPERPVSMNLLKKWDSINVTAATPYKIFLKVAKGN